MARLDELKGLERRWKEPGPDVLRSVRAELRSGQGRVASPFGDVAGRSDFRGLRLNPGDFRRRSQIGAAASERAAPRPGTVWSNWESMDFTGGDLGEMSWMQHRAVNCVFDDADLNGLRCWGVTVTDCSFRRSRLYQAQLGPGPEFWGNQSAWIGVDFRQADLRGFHATSLFADADFGNAKFRQSHLGWSVLRNCNFRGVVQGLSVGSLGEAPPTGWSLRGVDMRHAKPRDFLLHRVDLGQPYVEILLPEDEQHWLIPGWRAFLDRLEQAITALPAGDERKMATIWLDCERRNLGPEQTHGFVSVADVAKFGGASLLDLLKSSR